MSAPVDWDLVQVPAVVAVLDQVSTNIGHRFRNVTTGRDVMQEALILVATNGATVRGYLADESKGARYLTKWLSSRLYDVFRTPAQRAAKSGELPEELRAWRAADLEIVELGEQLRWLLAGITDDQRAAVLARHWLDLSEDEAADALGVPVGTVKSRCSRGLTRMRSALIAGTKGQDHFVSAE